MLLERVDEPAIGEVVSEHHEAIEADDDGCFEGALHLDVNEFEDIDLPIDEIGMEYNAR